jgi:hypothetical protein
MKTKTRPIIKLQANACEKSVFGVKKAFQKA